MLVKSDCSADQGMKYDQIATIDGVHENITEREMQRGMGIRMRGRKNYYSYLPLRNNQCKRITKTYQDLLIESGQREAKPLTRAATQQEARGKRTYKGVVRWKQEPTSSRSRFAC